MKNCCVLFTLLLAFLVLPESISAQSNEMATKAKTTKKCDLSKCTPEQLAKCKAVCTKTAAKDAQQKASAATLVSNKDGAAKKQCAAKKASCTKIAAKDAQQKASAATLVSNKDGAAAKTKSKKCCASKKASCSKSSSMKTSKLAESKKTAASDMK